MDSPDREMLRQYQQSRDPALLQPLIERHLPLVHASALRRLRNRELAEDVAQQVFMLFARKAASLPERVILAGWLFRTVRNVAANAMRESARRHHRELAAARPERQDPPDNPSWDELKPHIDAAIDRLAPNHRNALLLRYFQDSSLADVGRALNITEDAARKLIARALSHLRAELADDDVRCSDTALALALSHAISDSITPSAAPSIIQAALRQAAGPSTLLFATETLIMASAKTKIVFIVASLALIASFTVGAIAMSSRNSSAQTAPRPAPAPAASAQDQAEIQAVRQALYAAAELEANGDPASITEGAYVESPEFQPIADALVEEIRAVGPFRKALAETFGQAADPVLWRVSGANAAARQSILTSTRVIIRGDAADIPKGANAFPSVLKFRKVNGVWRFLIGGTFCPTGRADPDVIQSLQARARGYARATAALREGRCATPEQAWDILNAPEPPTRKVSQ